MASRTQRTLADGRTALYIRYRDPDCDPVEQTAVHYTNEEHDNFFNAVVAAEKVPGMKFPPRPVHRKRGSRVKTPTVRELFEGDYKKDRWRTLGGDRQRAVERVM